MKWFLAKLSFEITQEDADGLPGFDEQLRLLLAPDEREAFLKACRLGNAEAQEFLNMQGKKVYWRFVGVPELNPIKEPSDGLEVYTFSPEDEESGAYLDNIGRKFALLQQKLCPENLTT